MGWRFWLSDKTARTCAGLHVYCQRQKCSAYTPVTSDIQTIHCTKLNWTVVMCVAMSVPSQSTTELPKSGTKKPATGRLGHVTWICTFLVIFFTDKQQSAAPLPQLSFNSAPGVTQASWPKGHANRPFAFESNLESNRALRFEFESNLRVESFQLEWILIKMSNYKWSKRDVRNYIFLNKSSNTLNNWRTITHRASESLYCTTRGL